jgi:hypothetical protein
MMLGVPCTVWHGAVANKGAIVQKHLETRSPRLYHVLRGRIPPNRAKRDPVSAGGKHTYAR